VRAGNYTGTTDELAADGLGGVDMVGNSANISTSASAVSDSEAYIDAGKMGEGSSSSSSSSSGGNYLSALTGGMAGYNAGKKNYYTDENMTSGEDGFGTYHHDARAEVGGGTLGAYLGYEFGSLGSALSSSVVEAVHPFAESLTRDVINLGDDVSGVTGAMALDPAGAMASGKYSDNEILGSGFAGAMGIPVPEAAETVTKFLDDNCFITTAVCRQLGKSDNCHELETLRAFRDGWMKQNGMQEFIDEYYVKAPAIVQTLAARKDSDLIFSSFYTHYITPAVAAIEKNLYRTAFEIYKKLFYTAQDLTGA
jgi:hypothetical protein